MHTRSKIYLQNIPCAIFFDHQNITNQRTKATKSLWRRVCLKPWHPIHWHRWQMRKRKQQKETKQRRKTTRKKGLEMVRTQGEETTWSQELKFPIRLSSILITHREMTPLVVTPVTQAPARAQELKTEKSWISWEASEKRKQIAHRGSGGTDQGGHWEVCATLCEVCRSTHPWQGRNHCTSAERTSGVLQGSGHQQRDMGDALANPCQAGQLPVHLFQVFKVPASGKRPAWWDLKNLSSMSVGGSHLFSTFFLLSKPKFQAHQRNIEKNGEHWIDSVCFKIIWNQKLTMRWCPLFLFST